jgi:hypothetical protein
MKQIAPALLKAQRNRHSPEGRMEEARLLKLLHPPIPGKNKTSVGLPIERLLRRVTFGSSTCWYWIGSTSGIGYGCLPALGESKAHRVSYRIFKGDIPAGAKVLHKCDTRCCVNPDHLFVGTQAENVADMVSKGRNRPTSLCGEKNPMAKMTAKEVEQAKAMKQSGAKQADIARFFNVSPMTISRLIRGESWK